MEIKSDIEIAQSCEMKNIREIAATAGVDEKYLEHVRQLQGKGGLQAAQRDRRLRTAS